MADNDDIKVIKNERGISTEATRTGVEPRPRADGSLPPMSNARNPIVSDPAAEAPAPAEPRDRSGKTPGSAESGALDPAQKQGPGKTPGKAEG